MRPKNDDFAIPFLDDYKKLGTFKFNGAYREDEIADMVIVGKNDKRNVGLMWPVAPHITKLITAPKTCPMDSARVANHIQRCVENQYINALGRVVEDSYEQAELEVVGHWDTAFGYRNIRGRTTNPYVRMVILVPAKGDEYYHDRLLRACDKFHLDGIIAVYESGSR